MEVDTEPTANLKNRKHVLAALQLVVQLIQRVRQIVGETQTDSLFATHNHFDHLRKIHLALCEGAVAFGRRGNRVLLQDVHDLSVQGSVLTFGQLLEDAVQVVGET